MATKRERALARHEELLRYERQLWEAHRFVAGLDEVGAGPWAGPVMAACAVLDPDRIGDLVGVDDSKKLSPARRELLAAKIRSSCLGFAIAEATVEEIDRLNIRRASLLAMERALAKVREALPGIGHLLIDARELEGAGLPQTSLVRGDATSLSIAAASILAKVERDARMVALARDFPDHGFERHKGYGTQEHRDALLAHGPTPVHRRTFSPIKEMLGG